MNKEEKQAYNYLEKYINWETCGERNLDGDIKTILNLVKKQQKEIEDLTDKIGEEINFNKSLLETLKECIHKDRIRKLIKEKAKTDTYNFKTIAIKDLEVLLGKRTLNSLYGTMTKESEDNK